MRIDILTLFPKMFKGPFDQSIVRRAQDKKLTEINIHNLRRWTKDKYKTVDDRPYGGGAGMVLMIEPIYKALNYLKINKTIHKKKASQNIAIATKCEEKVILLSPRGMIFQQQKAQEFSKLDHLILICGHYEGIDERVSKYLVDEVISIGDYVLTGGEIPAMAITDAVVRLIPGVLGKSGATKNESFQPAANHQSLSLLEYPQYTRPINFRGWEVPDILLSGNHKKIEEWRYEQSVKLTKKMRPNFIRS